MRSLNLPSKDIFITYLLIVLSILATYFMPHIIKAILFIVIIILFYNSRRDYIYLAFLFFLVDTPGGLFFQQTEDIINISILNISFAEIFSICALLKYLVVIRKQKRLPFRKAYYFYFLFLSILILYGLLYGMKLSGTSGTGFGSYRRTVKMIFLFSLYLTIPAMFKEKWKMVRFVYLLFTFVIVNFMFQLFNIVTGISIHEAMGGHVFIGNETEIRPVYGTFMGFISLIMSLYFISKGSFNKKYLYIILTVSFLSIIISATRGWMIAYFFIVILYYISLLKINIFKNVMKILPLVFILLLLIQVNIINKQISFSFKRFSTLQLLIEGDITGGGSITRLTDRSVPVINKFYQKPVIGWGFTTVAFETYDPHVGNQSMLMSGGIIGYVVFLLSFLIIISVILRCKRDLGKYYDDAKYMHIFVIALAGLFIIHSSSTDLFSYMAPTLGYHVYKIVFLSVFFSIIITLINNSYNDFENNRKSLEIKKFKR